MYTCSSRLPRHYHACPRLPRDFRRNSPIKGLFSSAYKSRLAMKRVSTKELFDLACCIRSVRSPLVCMSWGTTCWKNGYRAFFFNGKTMTRHCCAGRYGSESRHHDRNNKKKNKKETSATGLEPVRANPIDF